MNIIPADVSDAQVLQLFSEHDEDGQVIPLPVLTRYLF